MTKLSASVKVSLKHPIHFFAIVATFLFVICNCYLLFVKAPNPFYKRASIFIFMSQFTHFCREFFCHDLRIPSADFLKLKSLIHRLSLLECMGLRCVYKKEEEMFTKNWKLRVDEDIFNPSSQNDDFMWI